MPPPPPRSAPPVRTYPRNNVAGKQKDGAPAIGKPNLMNAADRQAILKSQREAALRRRNLQLQQQRYMQKEEPEEQPHYNEWDAPPATTKKPAPPPPPPPPPPPVPQPKTPHSPVNTAPLDRTEDFSSALTAEQRPKDESVESDDSNEFSIEESPSLRIENAAKCPSPPSPRFFSSSEFSSSDDDASREEIVVSPAPAVKIGRPGTSTREHETNKKAESAAPSSAFSIISLGLDNANSMKTFLTSPVPKEAGTLECYVRRHKSGTKKSLFPEYRVYLKQGDIFLLTSKKRKNKKTSNYLISMGRNDFDKNSRNIVGKLRANFIGTEFQIYDEGRNPNKSSAYFDERSDVPVRSELGAIIYSSNLIGNRGPRQMQVCINKLDKNGKTTKMWQPAHRDEEMIQCFKHRVPAALRNLVVLENKEPQWNQELGAHVLNFNGRVTQASVKNFQLIDKSSAGGSGKDGKDGNNTSSNHKTVVLQFGRVAKDEFTLDFSWPLSPLQAFAIALSSCDAKPFVD